MFKSKSANATGKGRFPDGGFEISRSPNAPVLPMLVLD
jgi:hypothetical protein